MDSEGKEMAGSERRDNWYVIKGIPVAVLIALFVHGASFAWYLSGLNSRVETQSEKLTEAIGEWKSEMGKMNAKIDALANSVQSGSVPTALNQRRIEDMERQSTRLEARLSDMERTGASREARIQRIENALSNTNARLRARDER